MLNVLLDACISASLIGCLLYDAIRDQNTTSSILTIITDMHLFSLVTSI